MSLVHSTTTHTHTLFGRGIEKKNSFIAYSGETLFGRFECSEFIDTIQAAVSEFFLFVYSVCHTDDVWALPYKQTGREKESRKATFVKNLFKDYGYTIEDWACVKEREKAELYTDGKRSVNWKLQNGSPIMHWWRTMAYRTLTEFIDRTHTYTYTHITLQCSIHIHIQYIEM